MERSELDPAVAELLKGYRIVVTTMVAWGDMDANRHVNNTVYFRYIEHGRLWYFHELGFSREQQEAGIGPILAWADCRFRVPLSYPDTVSIGTRIIEVRDDQFTMQSVVVSHKLKKVAAEGQQRLVSYDYRSNQKAPLPESIRRRIEEFEKGA
ncbi:MAG: thioesterase family protein [Pirellulales bacterium]